MAAHEERPRPDTDRVREMMREEREEIEGEGAAPAEEPDLEEDPAYNPDDEGLKDIKGG